MIKKFLLKNTQALLAQIFPVLNALSDTDARVLLGFLGAPNAISLDAGHLWCLLKTLLAVFPIAPTIGKFTSPTALYGF